MIRVITLEASDKYDPQGLRTLGAPDGAPQAHRLAHPDRAEPRRPGARGRALPAHQDGSPPVVEARRGCRPGNVIPTQRAASVPSKPGRTHGSVRPHHSRNESRPSVVTQYLIREYARMLVWPRGAPGAHPTAHRSAPGGQSSARALHPAQTLCFRSSLKLRVPSRPRIGIIRSLRTALFDFDFLSDSIWLEHTDDVSFRP